MADQKYEMTMSLNILNHLGIKLYSNVSAVLSEVVANSWDADADIVEIQIEKDKITITDNGHGMTVNDANKKYLHVGYKRREEENRTVTEKHNRPIMGRKGIGKLSLFSVAKIIEVQSIKHGEKHGLRMSADKIEETIKKGSQKYYPEPIPEKEITFDRDYRTRIILTGLKKRLTRTVPALKKRLARRFSIIGSDYNFSVKINGELIQITDRGYFHKVQYLWYYGQNGKKYVNYCKEHKLKEAFDRACKLKVIEEQDNHEDLVTTYGIEGWIGSVAKSTYLKDGKDNLNKIVIMVRGKLAQEDILEDFPEGGLYTKYLIGELHADFFDMDDKEDIATTSRQEIIKDDPRYVALKDWVSVELKNIESLWTNLRKKEGTAKALESPAIKNWFDSLKPKNKKRAESLFGKINQLTVDSDEDKRELFKYSVLAFESLRYKDNLEALDSLTPANIEAFKEIFADLDDIEATLYHQIVKERIQVIRTLQEHVHDNALEKIIQQHLYEHLWLLDASWDRATETPLMEQQVNTAFKTISANLSKEEKKGRYDIRYKNPSGKHVIIELKRAKRSVNSLDLAKQVLKYKSALIKILKSTGKEREPVEVVCLVGMPCTDWTDDAERNKSIEMLEKRDIRVLMYQELIENAYISYKSFLEKDKEIGRIAKLIESI